ncbi:MAG: DUF1810 domain-containing protein [Marinibacterium sp.]|nr:DUF1810 domain-containing protein [Marinibacterium sp.]
MSLERFLAAQEADYAIALAEIGQGRKRSHWMWYIFPQLAGLGGSERARFYGLCDLSEARAYLAHPVLGPRLIAICTALLTHQGTRPEAILGQVDALKLRSSMTLFETAGDGPFGQILTQFYDGDRCPLTQTALR